MKTMLCYVRRFAPLAILLLLLGFANGFIIKTKILKTTVYTTEDVKLDESSPLKINTTALSNTQDSLLRGRFLIIPYYYKPLVEGATSEESSIDKRPTVSFKVRFVDGDSGEQFVLKCGSFFNYATHHKKGETQFCYRKNPKGDGRHIGIEYKIVNVIGPTFYEKSTTTYAIKEGEPQEVTIELEVRLRTSVRPRKFTDWISSQDEIEILGLAAGQHSQPQPGPQDIIPNYYIYFSDEDINTLAEYYVPYFFRQDLSSLGYAEREALVYQTLPRFFTLSEQTTGSAVECVPSETFSGTVIDGKTLGYVLQCSNVKKNTRYTATFNLPMPTQNQIRSIYFCWYVDSGGNLNECEG